MKPIEKQLAIYKLSVICAGVAFVLAMIIESYCDPSKPAVVHFTGTYSYTLPFHVSWLWNTVLVYFLAMWLLPLAIEMMDGDLECSVVLSVALPVIYVAILYFVQNNLVFNVLLYSPLLFMCGIISGVIPKRDRPFGILCSLEIVLLTSIIFNPVNGICCLVIYEAGYWLAAGIIYCGRLPKRLDALEQSKKSISKCLTRKL